jgi:tetratricopeptide (TPR) repeat protein
MMSPSDYQIGAWTVHPALDEVRRNGEVVKLEPRTMRLLLALALTMYGYFMVRNGELPLGLGALQRAVILDPLNHRTRESLASAYNFSRRFKDSIREARAVLAMDPADPDMASLIGLDLILLGKPKEAVTACQRQPSYWSLEQCLAIAEYLAGDVVGAKEAFARMDAWGADLLAYQHAEIYAQWGDRLRALDALERAVVLKDDGLLNLKHDPLLDPLRNEPRFKSIEALLSQMSRH